MGDGPRSLELICLVEPPERKTLVFGMKVKKLKNPSQNFKHHLESRPALESKVLTSSHKCAATSFEADSTPYMIKDARAGGKGLILDTCMLSRPSEPLHELSVCCFSAAEETVTW